MLLLITWGINAQTATPPSLGDGTIDAPYEYATLENLTWIAATDAVVASPSQAIRFAAHYIQTANIDASVTSTWPDGGWIPIGFLHTDYTDHSFRGTYDGQGNTISGLTINRPSEAIWYNGLFGYTTGATIQNLGILNVNMFEGSDAGGLAGKINSSTIINCYTTGSVVGASTDGGYCTGGLVSSIYQSSLSNCFSTCSVNGSTFIGGLVGYATVSTITYCHSTGNVGHSIRISAKTGGLVGEAAGTSISKCYSTGNVSASVDMNSNNYTGGFVGINGPFFASPTTPSSITDCYSSGNVSGGYLIGGFVSRNTASWDGSTFGTITNCYSRGLVTGNAIQQGFIADNYGTVSNCFFDADTDGIEFTSSGDDNYGATGKSTAEMKTQSTFTGWDFYSGIWILNEGYNDGYPYLNQLSFCEDGNIALEQESINQTVCANTAIWIVYTVSTGDMHTVGASISPALPPGLAVYWAGEENRYIIYGTPTVAGTYTYTVTTIGTDFPCNEGTATGTITVEPSFTPTVSIVSSDEDNKICYGTQVTFTAIASNTGGGTVSYKWFYMGNTYYDWGSSWTTWELEDGETVSCEITAIGGTCLTSTTAVSNTITTNVYDPLTSPSVTITSSDDDNNICYGTPVTFTATPVNTGGGTISYKWFYIGNTYYDWGSSWTSWELEDGETVSCEITVTRGTCFDTKSATSNVIKVAVYNCCTPGQTFEPNNILADAIEIGVGPEISGNITNSKDVDWYKFTTSDAGFYTINFYPNGGKESVDLCNSKGQKLRPGSKISMTYNLLANTTYYIKIYDTKLKVPSPCYSLSVGYCTFSPAGFIDENIELKSIQIEPITDGICKIWPNPTKNEFQIYNGNEYPIQVKIMDVIGSTIETIENVGIAETAVFGSKYKPGIYFVKTSENGVQKVFKLIKQ
jgi:hypothetical protein